MNIKRIITQKIQKYLETAEILILVGARQVGKTTILKQLKNILEKQNKTCYFLNLEDPEYLDLLNQHPKKLFDIFTFDLKPEKKYYVFIDEIQYLENPSNFLKYIFDEYKDKIKLIVSGSSAFYIDKKFTDSLAGRKKIFHIKTLSFREFLIFKNKTELAEIDLVNLSLDEKNKIEFFYKEFMIYGGYPRVVLADLDEKKEILREITYSYIKKDFLESNIKGQDIFFKLLKLLANQTGGLVNTNKLASLLGVSKTRINNYLYILRKSFHIALIQPFYKNLRKEITKMPEVYFYDSGLRNLLVNSFEKIDFRNDKGELLENMMFRQLLEKHNYDEIKFWRTTQQNEVDFVVDKNAYEIKISTQLFQKNKYKKFLTEYPEINFSVVFLEGEKKTEEGVDFKYIWEI